MSADPASAAVRHQIGETLARSTAFAALGEKDRQAFIDNLAKVGVFLGAQRFGADAVATSPAKPLARAQASAVDDTMGRLAKGPGQVGKDFTAGAMREGVSAFKDLVGAVDFPEFVSGLVKGVFNAVVDASIQQMQAYADMLAAVAKSVDQFANENISEAQARQHVAAQNPQLVQVENGRLTMRDSEGDTAALAQTYRLSSVDLSDDSSELALVNAAKLELARQRQQLLSTMVLMGINRIVVTNGRINAKVVFDITASDAAARKAHAGMSDQLDISAGAVAGVAAPWGAAGGYTNTNHRTSVRSSVSDTSESQAEMKAKLSGDVLLAFKSETLPLERMLDQGGIQLLTSKSQPPPSAAPPAPVHAPPPPPPPPASSPAPSSTGAHP
jgi:hypothetical protein